MSDFVSELIARADIIEIIGGEVALKRRGSRYVGLCPFHKEKTPSFTVDAQKGFYYCFGCQVGGNALSFLRDYRCGGDARAALYELAKICGVEVPPSGGDGRKKTAPIAPYLQKALAFYRDALSKSKRARAYLEKRGVNGQTAARFQLGYAPDGWRNLRGVFDDYDGGDLPVKAGLVREGSGKGRYDYFRDRLLFPIFSGDGGKIIGFGGRALSGDDPAKYLNSPQSVLFDKSRALFGLHLAREAARREGRVIVAEGYMDVVALSQAGLQCCAATMGTAATAAQMASLARFAQNIVFCFDGDAAGRRAGWRALENILPQLADGVGASFLFLPAGEDPDSVLQAGGREGFEKELARAVSLGDFLSAAPPPDDAPPGADPEGWQTADLRRRALLAERVNRDRAPFLYDLLHRKLSKVSGIPIADLRRATARAAAKDAKPPMRRRDAAHSFVMSDSPLFRLLCCISADSALAVKLNDAPLAGDRREVAVVEIARRKLAQSDAPLAELLREEGFIALAAQLQKERRDSAAIDPARQFAHIVAALAQERDRRRLRREVEEQITRA